MRDRRFSQTAILGALILAMAVAEAQVTTPVDHAKRVIDLLAKGQFEGVTQDFNAKMTAALPATQLADVWRTLQQQVGPFKAIIDERSQTAGGGITAVTLGCQFERAALNAFIAFDGESRIAGLRFVPRPAAATPVPAPSGSRFTEEAVTVGTAPWALPGTLSMPSDAVQAGVVLVHGSGPQDRDGTIGPNKPLRDLAWGLASRQIAVLRYEKRTRQHAGRLASTPQLTVQEEVIDDAVAAAMLLRQRPGIPSDRVFVLGHSLGGTLAPRIATQNSQLAGVIIMAGAALPFWDLAREQVTYLSSLQPSSSSGSPSVEESLAMLRRAAPESYWKDLEDYRPLDVAGSLKLPLLVLQGERDYQVTMENFGRWRKALDGRSATFKSYPTLNHLFLPGTGKSTPAEYEHPGQIPAAVLDDIATWVKDHTR